MYQKGGGTENVKSFFGPTLLKLWIFFKISHQIHSFYPTKIIFTNKFNVRVPQTH